MQNIIEANNKFEKFLLPIISKLSMENRIISNYRMLLNKEITNENINELTKRFNQFSDSLLEIIALKMHITEENHANNYNFINSKNLFPKEMDLKKIESVYAKHYEIMVKLSKNSFLKDEELNELNSLENSIFSFIRLGNDCERDKINYNNKNCMSQQKYNNLNNLHNLKNNTLSTSPNVNINSSGNLNTNNNNNTENGSYSFNLNSKNCFNRNLLDFSENNISAYNTIILKNNEKEKLKENEQKNDSMKKPPKNILFEVINANNNNNILNKKENNNLFKNNNSNTNFENVSIFNINDDLNNIESIRYKKTKNNSNSNNKENLNKTNKNKIISNANQTLNHFLKENSNAIKANHQIDFVKTSNNNAICNYQDNLIDNKNNNHLNYENYFNYRKHDYYQTACEVESYMNSDNNEINTVSNPNFCSNNPIDSFVEKKTMQIHINDKLFDYINNNKNKNDFSNINENVEVFKMFIENQIKIDMYNPLPEIFNCKNSHLSNKKENSLEYHSPVKTESINKINNNNNTIYKIINHNNGSIINSSINLSDKSSLIVKSTNENKFTDIDIFFEKAKEPNIDSTGGDFDRELNSIDDFSHASSDIDDLKKEKIKNTNTIKNKALEEQILKDPNSNYNYYSRQYIPKVNKKSEKFKNTIPFLRDFNPKFLKKENIDKKILRKFRNFVKCFIENDKNSKIYSRINSKEELQKSISVEYDKYKDVLFLKKFYKQNLLPPMNYCDESNNIVIEFKSFNTNYMLWLFSQEGINDLYKLFTENLGNEILNDFIQSYNLEIVNKKTEIGIIQMLSDYIFSIEKIYTSSKKSSKNEQKKNSICSTYTKNDKKNLDNIIHNEITKPNSPTSNEYINLNANLNTAKNINKIKVQKEKIDDKKNNLDLKNNNKNNQKTSVCDKIVLEFDNIYNKTRSYTMTSEDIFDKCIDDLEIKNQAMMLDFYSSKREEKRKLSSEESFTKNRNTTIEPSKFWNHDVNYHVESSNLNNNKKSIAKFANEDQMYFEGFSNNQQIENINYFY